MMEIDPTSICQCSADILSILSESNLQEQVSASDPVLLQEIENIRHRFKTWAAAVGALASSSDHTSLDYLQQKDIKLAEVVLDMLSALRKIILELINPVEPETESLVAGKEELEEDSTELDLDSDTSSVSSYNPSGSDLEDSEPQSIRPSIAGNRKWDYQLGRLNGILKHLQNSINKRFDYLSFLEDRDIRRLMEEEKEKHPQDHVLLIKSIEEVINHNLQSHLLRPEIKHRLASVAHFRSMKLLHLGQKQRKDTDRGGTATGNTYQQPSASSSIVDSIEIDTNQMEQALQELRPYVCLFPHCSVSEKEEGSGLPIFSTAHSWLHHMQHSHRTDYFCRLCSGNSSDALRGTTSSVFFETLDDLEEHFRVKHPTSPLNHTQLLNVKVTRPFSDLLTPELFGGECDTKGTQEGRCCRLSGARVEENPTASPELIYRSIRTHLEILAIESLPGGTLSSLSSATAISEGQDSLAVLIGRDRLMEYVVGKERQEGMVLLPAWNL